MNSYQNLFTFKECNSTKAEGCPFKYQNLHLKIMLGNDCIVMFPNVSYISLYPTQVVVLTYPYCCIVRYLSLWKCDLIHSSRIKNVSRWCWRCHKTRKENKKQMKEQIMTQSKSTLWGETVP